jgi:hypothetical protein
MPIPALMGWIGGLSAGAKLSMASSVVSGLSSYAAAKAQRKQAIADQDNQYVRMRNAAQRAGFNPLTVMRATGGQGFTGLPVISKAAAFGNMATGIFDTVAQDYVDKYEKKIEQAVQPKMTPFVKSKNINTERYTAQVSPKDWKGLTKDVQKQIANAENIAAQGKIDGAVNTVAKFKALGAEFEGSGLFGAMPSYEETLGEFGSTVMAPVLATDAVVATARKEARKNMITWPKKKGRTTTSNNYKIHREDILLGVLPPLSRKYFTTNGVTTEGYAR